MWRDFFGRWQTQIIHIHGNATGTRGFHLVRIYDNLVFEIWTEKIACFFLPCCDGDQDGCESLDWVDGWDRVSLPLDQRAIVELTPLDDDHDDGDHDDDDDNDDDDDDDDDDNEE